MLKHQTGILSAPTAFGKTVMAASIIARRKVSTLILVHRAELLQQWRERLFTFLDLFGASPGFIGSGKKKLSGLIDIAVMQSLSRRDDLAEQIPHSFLLHGRLTKKQRAATLSGLTELDDRVPRLILATGRLIGEGFDHPPLDTMVLAMPVSWHGTLQQYAGRLHREHVNKGDVRIYDYVEHDHPQLARMWEKRQRGYRAMGYRISMREGCSE